VASRDARELGWGMGEAIRAADLRIYNVGSVDDLEQQIETILQEINING